MHEMHKGGKWKYSSPHYMRNRQTQIIKRHETDVNKDEGVDSEEAILHLLIRIRTTKEGSILIEANLNIHLVL